MGPEACMPCQLLEQPRACGSGGRRLTGTPSAASLARSSSVPGRGRMDAPCTRSGKCSRSGAPCEIKCRWRGATNPLAAGAAGRAWRSRATVKTPRAHPRACTPPFPVRHGTGQTRPPSASGQSRSRPAGRRAAAPAVPRAWPRSLACS